MTEKQGAPVPPLPNPVIIHAAPPARAGSSSQDGLDHAAEPSLCPCPSHTRGARPVHLKLAPHIRVHTRGTQSPK